MTTIERPVHGAFDLRQSIGFGFGHRRGEAGDVMRLAFVVEGDGGYAEQAGVAVTQPAPGRLRFEVSGEADPEQVVDQAARVLSADVDATAYDELVARDPVLARAAAVRPGLRPVLFYSAYEALLWAILSARRPMAQMARVRDALAREHGRVFDVAGEPAAAMPTPAQLLVVEEFPDVPEPKLQRMKAVAQAAADGELDTEALRRRDAEEVEQELQRFAGIGPFYSQLVTVRALGQTDALPTVEPRVVAQTGVLLGRELDQAEFAEVAEGWRPWRTWASVAIRSSSGAPPA